MTVTFIYCCTLCHIAVVPLSQSHSQIVNWGLHISKSRIFTPSVLEDWRVGLRYIAVEWPSAICTVQKFNIIGRDLLFYSSLSHVRVGWCCGDLRGGKGRLWRCRSQHLPTEAVVVWVSKLLLPIPLPMLFLSKSYLLEQAAQRGSGVSSLEIFKTHRILSYVT